MKCGCTFNGGLLQSVSGAAIFIAMAVSATAEAQEFDDIDDQRRKPLVIEEQGSFFIGGETKNRAPDDDVTIHQMYVEYQVPAGKSKIPVVMTHGCCLSSKTWETTPDGRMGWSEYFVRNHHSVYLTDQVGRARSGFDATPFNLVREGELDPSQQPSINQASHQFAWEVFRFGPFEEPFPDLKFPIEAVDELYRQMIPDLNAGLPEPNPNWQALSDLALQIEGTVLMGHSQSGTYPFEAALINAEGVRGLISIEPGSCDREGYTQEQIETLAGIPILVMFGDYLNEFDGFWQDAFDNCNAFIEQVNIAGGNATMLWTPGVGIFGNSHMLMQDENSLELADLVLGWIDENVERRP